MRVKVIDYLSWKKGPRLAGLYGIHPSEHSSDDHYFSTSVVGFISVHQPPREKS